MKDNWVKGFVALFLITMVAFAAMVINRVRAIHEANLDYKCKQIMKEDNWASTAPPMEKNDVWINHRTLEKKNCESRSKGSKSP